MFTYSPFYPALLIIVGLVLCLVLHWLIGKLADNAVRRLDASLEADETSALQTDHSLRKLYVEWIAKGARTLLWLLFIAFTLSLIPTLQDDLLKARATFQQTMTRAATWLLGQGLGAAIILVITIFLMRFCAALIKTAFTLYEQRMAANLDEHSQRRSQTLSAIFSGVAQAIIFFIGLMVALQQGGLDITPILASAGIVGIAVGFGAQSLIKDLFAGLMILFEEQYSVGDSIKIGEVSGTVEALTLRSTRVRGSDGALTMFPNGNITTVANLSKDWLRVVLDFEVDYVADVDAAMKIMSEVAAQMKVERPTEILEEPVMQGVDKVAGGVLTLRLIFKTVPAKQAEISRELRRRVKVAFDQAGIKGPARPAN